jgi:hypothetical protein
VGVFFPSTALYVCVFFFFFLFFFFFCFFFGRQLHALVAEKKAFVA